MRYFWIIGILLFASCQKNQNSVSSSSEAAVQNLEPKEKLVELTTSFGTMTLKLYDETPLHKENFLKLADEGYFDSLMFHRVMKNFMIQGGDPNSKLAEKGEALGMGGPGYTIPAEFNTKYIHKKGALAAARRGGPVNPNKESSGSQFYIVHGNMYSEDKLEMFQKRIRAELDTAVFGDFSYTAEQKELYKTIGGAPHLDMDYTVFGEVIDGINIIDSIANVKTSYRPKDRPIEDVRMFLKVIEK